jgi:hypothetical protein
VAEAVRVGLTPLGRIAQQPVPSAVETPARPEARHEEIPPARLDAHRGPVTIRALDAVRQQVQEEDRREDGAQDEEPADDKNRPYSFAHTTSQPLRGAILQALLDFSPRFDVGNPVFDSVDHDLRTRREHGSVNATCGQYVRRCLDGV